MFNAPAIQIEIKPDTVSVIKDTLIQSLPINASLTFNAQTITFTQMGNVFALLLTEFLMVSALNALQTATSLKQGIVNATQAIPLILALLNAD